MRAVAVTGKQILWDVVWAVLQLQFVHVAPEFRQSLGAQKDARCCNVHTIPMVSHVVSLVR